MKPSRSLPRTLPRLALALLLAAGVAVPTYAAASAVDAASASAGARLFSGQTRFAHGGAACISCHSADGGGLPSAGGRLAIGLGHSWVDIGPAGIQAIVASPPFAPMAAAYADHPLTPDETDALLAFFQRSAQQPRPVGMLQRPVSMLLAGLGGSAAVVFALHLLWGRRKTLSTKHSIYARQARRG